MFMRIRKTISLGREDYDAIAPLVAKHKGNFSAAVKDLIHSGRKKSLNSPVTPEDVEENAGLLRDLMIEERLGLIVPPEMFIWAMGLLNGIVPPIGAYRSLFEGVFPEILGHESFGIKEFSRYINPILRLTGTGSRVKITYDNPESPTSVRIRYDMRMPGDVEVFAKMTSLMVAHRPLLLKPTTVERNPATVTVEYLPAGSEEDAHRAVVEHFGSRQHLLASLAKNEEPEPAQ